MTNCNDDILSGITFDELIVTLQSNEPHVDKTAVKRVYKEILKAKLEDAMFELERNMDYIIGQTRED
jgi:hypothetical protein